LKAMEERGFFKDVVPAHTFDQATLNKFMTLGRPTWKKVRHVLTEVLSPTSAIRDDAELKSKLLHPRSSIRNLMPCIVNNYTDFYASKEHATNLGKMFRPDEAPLKPNWIWLPVGYHGRASSVVVSGHELRRPCGQTKPPADEHPAFRTCARLDYDVEMATYIGPGNSLGNPIPIKDAYNHIFGMGVLNDWSARDIQNWEYVPLGPFTGKNLLTTVSPWIVTMEALEPFRVEIPAQDPPPLGYLVHHAHPNDGSQVNSEQSKKRYGYDIHITVEIQTEKMSSAGVPPQAIATTNLKYMYWSTCQQVAQHTVTGCNLVAGDILGTGTISGTTSNEYGSLIESTWSAKNPIAFAATNEQRTFLADGDTVIMKGMCKGNGYCIGFGECSGKVTPAFPHTYFTQ